MRPGSLGARLFVGLQHVLPQHAISRIVLVATRVRWRPFKDLLIAAFMRGFRPVMQDAIETDPLRYASFNDFFTRALKPGARAVTADPDLVASPVDGTISQLGRIDGQNIIQAKGRGYSLAALLADAGLPGAGQPGAENWTRRFTGGCFATLYLAPYNYHRIHMPLAGGLRATWFVPGRLFSVNAVTAAAVQGLFARNERVVCAFEGESGPFAMVLVGALNVGSIATVWHGDVAPRRPRRITALEPATQASLAPATAAPMELAKGDEMGRFNMGSTVILLFPPDAVQWLPELGPGTRITMGMPLARRA